MRYICVQYCKVYYPYHSFQIFLNRFSNFHYILDNMWRKFEFRKAGLWAMVNHYGSFKLHKIDKVFIKIKTHWVVMICSHYASWFPFMYSYRKIKIHMILSCEYVLYTYIQETYIVTIWQFDELKLMWF